MPDLSFEEGVFGSSGVACGVDCDFGLVAALVEDGKFGCGRGRLAFDAPYTDSGYVVSMKRYTGIDGEGNRKVKQAYLSLPICSTRTLFNKAFTSLFRYTSP